MAWAYVNDVKPRKLVQRFGIELLSEWLGLLNRNQAHSGLQNQILKVNVKAICRLYQRWLCLPSSWLRSPCAIHLQAHGSQAPPGTS